VENQEPLLTPFNAWRIIRARTNMPIGRSTFYRWVESGKVFCFQPAGKIAIPWSEVDRVIKVIRNGERL